jgi:hypothetical protein
MAALHHPPTPVAPDGHFVYSNVLYVLQHMWHMSNVGLTYLNIVLLFGQALYLNGIANRFRLFLNTGNTVAYTFIILTAVIPTFSYFSEAMIVNWCVMGALDVMLRFPQTVYPRKHIFNAGFLMCLPALIHFPSLAYIVILFVALSTLRPFSPSEWVVGFMGYLTPIYFLSGILFLTDHMEIVRMWPQIGHSIPIGYQNKAFMIGALSGIAVLFGCGIYVMQRQMSTAVYVKRSWAMLTIFMFISVLVATVSESKSSGSWLVVMPGLSLLVAHAFSLENSKWFSNIVFYFSLLFVVYCQIAFK